MNKIEIRNSNIHNRGVFCVEDIKKDEIIEISELIILNEKDSKIIDNTFLYNYYFSWKNNSSVICLGYGSLYNHSIKPNSKYIKDFENNKIIFIAIDNIKKGEEIFVNYNGIPESDKKVWFEE
jgi:SET domain-containing protein